MRQMETDIIVPFLNDFEREHYFRCKEVDERMKSMHYTVEFAKAQSQRWDELVRKAEEESKLKKKNSSKSEQEPQTTGTNQW